MPTKRATNILFAISLTLTAIITGLLVSGGTLRQASAQTRPAELTTAQVLNALPPGTILPWYGRSGRIPAGWFPCDGSNGTPNLVGRFLVGAANQGEVGQRIGANRGKANLPAHSHSLITGKNEGALREEGGRGIILHTTTANFLVNGYTDAFGPLALDVEYTPPSVKVLFIMKGF